MTCDSGQDVRNYRCLGLVKLASQKAAALNIRGRARWLDTTDGFHSNDGARDRQGTLALTDDSCGMQSGAACHKECVGGGKGLEKGFGTP